jgi:hypothetical protein
MTPAQSLAPRSPANLVTVHDILEALVARYRQDDGTDLGGADSCPRSQVSSYARLGSKCLI